MSYMVFCTFDLKGASRSDYDHAYADLKAVGLSRVVVSDKGQDVVIPTTSVIGKFNGPSSEEVSAAVREKVKRSFQSRGFTAEIFVFVGGNWGWSATRT
jgi:hypothetical protein